MIDAERRPTAGGFALAIARKRVAGFHLDGCAQAYTGIRRRARDEDRGAAPAKSTSIGWVRTTVPAPAWTSCTFGDNRRAVKPGTTV